MVSSYFSLLIQSPGVSNGRAQGSPTCINRTAANDRLADWLSYGRLLSPRRILSDRYLIIVQL